jgi:hypothetical protein
MGQFEYSVPLSPVKPEDIERVAKEYLERKETGRMIKYEFETLVLDSSHNKKDQEAVDLFVESQINKERSRILNEIEAESQGYSNVSIAKFTLRQIITGKAY